MWRFIKAILLCGPRIIYSYFAWMIKYSRHPEKYPLELRYSKLRNLIAFVARHLRITYDFKNLDVINKMKEPFVVVSNHASDFDPLMFIVLIDHPISFVAKIELYKRPFIGRCIRCLGGVFLDRNDLRQQLKVLRFLKDDLSEKGNVSWLIFPEGTRNRDAAEGDVLPFHYGSFKIPLQSGVPLVYVATYGTHRTFKRQHLKQYPCTGVFFPPMYKDEYEKYNSVDLSELVYQRINDEVKNLRIEDHKALGIAK